MKPSRMIRASGMLALGLGLGLAGMPHTAEAHAVKTVVVVKTKPAYPVARAVTTVVRAVTAPYRRHHHHSLRVVRTR